MTDPLTTAKQQLATLATELDDLSRKLTTVSRDLEPVDKQVKDFIRNHELGLYHRSIQEPEFKLPAERIRDGLALQALPPETYGRWVALREARDRLKQRIGDIKTEVESWRSVLSAEKVELEAGGARPPWTQRSAA